MELAFQASKLGCISKVSCEASRWFPVPLMSVFHDILLIPTLNRFELTTGDGRPDTTDVCYQDAGGKPSSQPCNVLYAMHPGEIK